MGCSSDAKAVDAKKSGNDGKLKVKSVKFLCSYGGSILARPSDGRLRYVGGETRLVVVNTEIRFSELMKKLEDLCSSGVRMKYQLPWEDLDTLVSVTCDEDVQFMMEEYETFEFQSQHYKQNQQQQQPKLRAFLFPATPSWHEEPRSPTQAYIELVNGRCITASQRQIQRTKMMNNNAAANNYINLPERLVSDASENPQASSSSNHRFTPPGSPRSYLGKTQSNAENGGHFHQFQMRRVPSEGIMAANLSSGSPPKIGVYAQHQIQIQGHNRMHRVHSTPNLDQCTASVGNGVRHSSQSTRYAPPLRFTNLGY